jgi:uncharacterized protein (PEP-CTERM system associated)
VRGSALLAAFGLASCWAWAEGDAIDTATGPSLKSNWHIVPSLALEGTNTDNVNLTAAKTSAFITRISPGLRIDGAGARTSGSLDYQWQSYSYSDNSTRNNLQRSLAAQGKAELIENWLFLDGSHNTSQQTVSAFGTQSVGNELTNRNRAESASYMLAPHIQGVLGGVVEYQLRYSGSTTRSDSGALSGGATTTRSTTGRLAGATPLAVLGWSVDAAQQVIASFTGPESRSQSATGTLTFQLDPQFRFLATAGSESDNFTSAVTQKTNSNAFGVDWAPTERTKLSLKKDKHTFGNGFLADFTHRTELSAWQFSDSRSVRTPAPQASLVRTGSIYDLFYQQLTSSVPDPTARAAATRQSLAQAGLSPDAPVFGQIQTSQAFVERRQQASLALMGANNTVTFVADRSISNQLSKRVGVVDDFSLSSEIRQSGFNTSWAHKLSPYSSLTLNAQTSRSSGSGSLATSLRALSLQLTTQIGASTSASVALRKNNFTGSGGTSSSYDERALVCAVTFRF